MRKRLISLLLLLGCSGDGNALDGSPVGKDAGGKQSTDARTAADARTLPDAASGKDAQDRLDAGSGAARTVTFTNKCAQSTWVGALNGDAKYELPSEGGFELLPGQSVSMGLPAPWGGRFWGRSGCAFDGSGKGNCATGDCGGREKCGGIGGQTPASLAEFFFGGYGGKDFYDVSLVDGYNLPIGIAPKEGTYTRSDARNIYDCGSPACVSELNATCPSDLQKKDALGRVVGCFSACEKFNTDQYCCRGAYGSPETCPPTTYSQVFKAACPTAYSYAYDDKTSTFTCKGTEYEITFCP
ncbi:MAG: thaumatin family protein [Deltaproteobacteria bacterium]|nr:thaumatin family protein [Deltaproteobacteria bacterium]